MPRSRARAPSPQEPRGIDTAPPQDRLEVVSGSVRRNDRPGLNSTTSHDVAKAAGVSQSTVSRALRNDPRISPRTREAVNAAVARLGYVPSATGRSLVTRSTRTIGIVVTDLTSVFYPHVIAPLHSQIVASGYRMVLFTEEIEPTDSRGPDVPGLPLGQLLDRSIDGAVLTTSRLDGEVPRELARRGLPFVFLARHVDGVAADRAIVDNSLGASLGAGEAVRLGHERIAAILGPANTSTGRDRERGIRATLAASSREFPDELVRRGPYTFESGYQAMSELIVTSPPPTVVLCANDTVAIGAYNAALAAGLQIPQDVSLVGFDDLPIAAWEVFSLTTIHQPMEEMARAAVRLLVERIERQPDPANIREIVFEPTLVLRRTLAPPPERR
jgi:LacI family transcriptional regulator